MTTGAIRSFAIGVPVVFLLGCAAIAAGLRYNGSRSFPVGLYLATYKRPEKGDLVLVDLPALPILALAKERGYLNVAYSPTTRILKRLVGAAGDIVTIDLKGVQVNGIRLTNSAPLPCDGGCRPLQPCMLKDRILSSGEILLMSDYNPASFDSRYFGPLQATAIESVVTPVLTWN